MRTLASKKFDALVAQIMRGVCIVDALREFLPPFSPEAVVAEISQLLKSYNVSRVTGDRYGGEWPRESFSRYGIMYELSAMTKSQLYGALLPLLNSTRIDLLDSPRLVSQLANLERKTARGGRDSIDHPQGQHDDLANVCAGLAAITIATSGYSLELLMRVNGEYDDQQAAQRFANEASRPTWGPDAPELSDWATAATVLRVGGDENPRIDGVKRYGDVFRYARGGGAGLSADLCGW